MHRKKERNNYYMKKAIGVVCSMAMVANYALPVYAVQAENPTKALIAEIAKGKYTGQEDLEESESTAGVQESTFIKISHPENPGNKMEHDPTESAEERKIHEETEVWADGLLDYIGNGVLAEPKLGVGPRENPGDRSQSYSWTGIAYGDWMYVSTQFNSAGLTGDLMGTPINPEQTDKNYGGDYFSGVEDGGEPGNTLSKINVKTGEVQILMSASENGLNAQFRNSVEYKGKLYFCGSVNHVPSIYEVDPTNDAFKCVYQDPSMVNYPGGLGEAWKVARNERLICPTIRGLTTFGEYLVISCVGLDENPYIAITDDPDQGFKTIARTWKDVELDDSGRFVKGTPAELLGYPACHIPDSIFGGSIWEMAEVDGKLYVAICTGTPAIAKEKGHTHMEPKLDENGNETGEEIEVIDEMQSFALIRGELIGEDPTAMESWKWTPVAGDAKDGARYPFGIDEERTRAGACNLVKYNGKLYIGEYNDTQIAFQNMQQKQFTFLKENLEQSVSLYRMDFDENGNEKFVKIMGDPTTSFPNTVSGEHTLSGFGTNERTAKETQYIWQSKVYDGKLYLGTFDETMILRPLIKQISEQMQQVQSTMHEAASLRSLADGEDDEEVIALYTTVENKVEEDTSKGLLKELEPYFDAEKNPSMLPAEIVEAKPIVKVDSVETLYEALLKADELEKSNQEVGIREEAAHVSQYLKLNQEVSTYLETTEDEIPSNLQGAAQTFAGEESQQSMYEDVQYILENMEGAIAGFDMHVSSDGIHFDKITVNGFGDPYNQGLRVFAANNSEDNKWMAIGTANAFYGTSIWRKEDLLNVNPVDPKQHRISIEFVNAKTNKVVKNALDQGDTMYVNVKEDGSLEDVVPHTIEQLLPKDHTFVDPDTPVAVKEDKVVFKVNADVKDVVVNFVGKDETENLGTAHVQILRSKEKLAYEDYVDVLPKGYTVKDPSLKVEITKNDEGQSVASVQILKGQNATIVNGKAFINKTEMKKSEENVVCIVPETTVTLVADESEEQTFYKWKADVVLENAYAKETTFEMPNQDVHMEVIYQGSANKEELVKTIQEAEKKEASHYTEESFDVLQSALESAKQVDENALASQEEVDQAVSSLKNAMDALVEKEQSANKETLNALIQEAEQKDATIYTEESFAALQSALESAKQVSASTTVSQEEVDQAADSLKKAMDALVQKPNTVNKEILNALIQEAEQKDATIYTEESFAALQSALESAKQVSASTTASQEEVDQAADLLKKAMDALVEKEQSVNKETLNALIQEAEQKNPTVYTEESFTALQSALQSAKQVSTSTTASQEEVDQAADLLKKAMDALVEKEQSVNKETLNALIQEAEQKDPTVYTEESFAALQSALQSAKQVDENASASQEEVDQAVSSLKNAMNALVKKAPIVHVNKQKLVQAIQVAESKEASLYTKESYSILISALQQAKAVDANASATQKEVDAAYEALQTALSGLKEKQKKVNKESLKDAIEKAGQLDSKKYTSKSFEGLQSALAAAKKVEADDLASQKDVDLAYQDLKDAIDALVKKAETEHTGVSTNVLGYAGLAIVATAVFAFVKRRSKK